MDNEAFDRCIERICWGEKEALREIYEAYRGYVYQLLCGILGSHENAEDVTSEFFIRIWEIADRYEPGNGHKTWLSRIARNMGIDYLRSHKREEVYDLSGGENISDDEIDAKQVMIQNKLRQEDMSSKVVGQLGMEQLLKKLKPKEREIIDMKIIADMTFQEISQTLGIPMGTVTWRYRQAINKLRRCGYEK